MTLKLNKIYNEDCLGDKELGTGMWMIPDKSVDMILCDLPYEITSAKWDIKIPFDDLWEHYNRIIKPHGAIVLFANQPFTTKLISSNYKGFKYCWTWNKKIPSGIGYAKYRPMQQTEDICVFTSKGEKTVYNPQMIKRDKPIKSGGNNIKSESTSLQGFEVGSEYKKTYDYKNPVTLLEYMKVRKGAIHSTQKPVDLCEYLIKTYTQEGEVVLDNCMGSGTTAIACINTSRNYIGFELNDDYYNKALERIELHKKEIS